MDTQYIGILSGVLVVASAIPYSIRAYQRKIRPNIASWSLWAFIGLALLLTYKDSGAESNVWPAVFGFTNPCIIATLAVIRKSNWQKLTWIDWLCAFISLASLVLWWFVRQEKELVQYALYLAIIADGVAAIPTFAFVWREPWEDRPFAWGFFGIAYGLAAFAITDHTFANYVLPLYMFVGASSMAAILGFYLFKKRAPLSEWI